MMRSHFEVGKKWPKTIEQAWNWARNSVFITKKNSTFIVSYLNGRKSSPFEWSAAAFIDASANKIKEQKKHYSR